MKGFAVLGLMLVFLAGPASAADYQTLRSLKAPEPRALAPLPAGPQTHTVKFARLAFQLQPQPWAILEGELDGRSYSEHVLVWNEGQVDVDQTMISQIVAEEMTAAHIPVEGATQSLFAQATTADLQLGVTITDMTGRFCRACATGLITSAPSTNWAGVVVLTARWEVYSTLDRKVVATVETRGGFNTSKAGLPGTPERLIYEALRDGSRRLIASEEFRRVVATPLTTPSAAASGAGNAPIVLLGPQTGGTLTQAMASVAIVFAAGGSGSGFLVSKDGYVLTNHHVAGDAKYVKLKWSNGEETLGEVIRSDRRRDVALVKTDAKGRAPLALRTGSVQLGESVFAIGTPLDDKLQNTLTKGIVSANRVYEGQPFIQSDVAVTHGNSGGPLLDEKGRVLGLTVSGRAPDGAPVGLNFFIPIDDALRALALKPAA